MRAINDLKKYVNNRKDKSSIIKKESLEVYKKLHQRKSFKIAFVVVVCIFIYALYYSSMRLELGNITGNINEKYKINLWGYDTNIKLIEQIKTDAIVIALISAFSLIRTLYIPILATPLLALNISYMINAYYFTPNANIACATIAAIISIIAYAYALALSNTININQRNKYKYNNPNTYSMADLKITLLSVLGTDKQVKNAVDERDIKIKTKIKKSEIYNVSKLIIVYIFVVSMILLMIGRFLFTLAI